MKPFDDSACVSRSTRVHMTPKTNKEFLISRILILGSKHVDRRMVTEIREEKNPETPLLLFTDNTG